MRNLRLGQQNGWTPARLPGAYAFWDLRREPTSDGSPIVGIDEHIRGLDAEQATTSARAQMVQQAAPPYRYAKLDGTDDHYKIGTASTFNFLHESGGWVAATVQIRDGTHDGIVDIARNADTSSERGVSLYWDNVSQSDTLNFEVFSGSSGSPSYETVLSSPTLADEEWHVIVASWDGTDCNLWLDEKHNNQIQQNAFGTGDAQGDMEVGRLTTIDRFGPINIANLGFGSGRLTEHHKDRYRKWTGVV